MCIGMYFYWQYHRSNHFPHRVGWEWNTEIEGDDLMNSSCKSPDMLPGIVSMSEANAINIYPSSIVRFTLRKDMNVSAGSQ